MSIEGIKDRLSEIILEVTARKKGRGLSNAKVAKEIGFTTNQVDEHRRGVRKPDVEFIAHFCMEYGYNPGWVLTGHGNKYIDPEKERQNRKDASGEARLHQPTPGYKAIGKEELQNDSKEWEMVGKAHDVLMSNTVYAAALAANVNAFYAAISSENEMRALQETHKDLIEKIDKLFDSHTELTNKITHLETVRWAKDKIRENDPPEQKEEIIKKRS